MQEYLFTREPVAGSFDPGKLDGELKAVCAKVLAITVAHHCVPYAVFVHCSDALTASEQAAVGQAIQQHSAV